MHSRRLLRVGEEVQAPRHAKIGKRSTAIQRVRGEGKIAGKQFSEPVTNKVA
jgi:hypothetical protein